MSRLVISDNGTYFKASAEYFKKVLEIFCVTEFSNENEIFWKFIIYRAPWQGGFYERLIKLYRKKVNLNQLKTIILEIQNKIVNFLLTKGYHKVDLLVQWCFWHTSVTYIQLLKSITLRFVVS